MTIQLGNRVRSLRKEHGITLTAMSEKTGLSLGYLSKLENNRTSPTIAQLHKICEALGLTLNEILSEEPPKQSVTVVRAGERQKVFEQNGGGLQFESITQGHTVVQGTAMTIANDMTYDSEPHTHDELGIVATGVLEIIVDHQTYRLMPGDSIYICADTMHSSRRATDEVCVSYWLKPASTIAPK